MKNDFTFHTLKLRSKILLARIIYLFFKLCRIDDEVQIKRKNINWKVNINDIVGLSVFLTGGFQNKKLKEFNNLILENTLLVDIGANIGTFSIRSKVNNKNIKKILCVEPDIDNFKRLKKNIEENKLSFTVFPFLNYVGESLDKKSSSHYPLNLKKDRINNRYNGMPGNFKKAIQFDLKNITTENFDNLAIKIDVDGNEFEVLSSLEQIINQYKPIMLIEINKGLLKLEELDKIYNILNNLNYKIVSNNKNINLKSLKMTSKLYGRDLIFKVN
tara:strand:- start:734 stop:1552 length:819 start_codon:yes stop_codon:yes gene_type:complete